ncbi:unnamed protein product [Miscanthus lutarioriparius]|uniref:Uncharacterized protein n=1 Tax=Miscanthus lutarioriparius TaxID=422564 RepID=A0A811QKA9_9POAL|nr:unnamed protein product [Miscanthus lutarioriparius]
MTAHDCRGRRLDREEQWRRCTLSSGARRRDGGGRLTDGVRLLMCLAIHCCCPQSYIWEDLPAYWGVEVCANLLVSYLLNLTNTNYLMMTYYFTSFPSKEAAVDVPSRPHVGSRGRRMEDTAHTPTSATRDSIDLGDAVAGDLLVGSDVKFRVIVVGCKLHLRDGQFVSLEQVMAPIMQSFREIEICIECSALRHIQVPEVFYYAQKAVLHPTTPLFDQEVQSLKPLCVIMEDISHIGGSCVQEMQALQRACKVLKILVGAKSIEDSTNGLSLRRLIMILLRPMSMRK